MRVLFVTDRISVFGGADQHLLQIIAAAVEAGDEVTVACGHVQPPAAPPPGARLGTVRGLSSQAARGSGLAGLAPLLEAAEVVHVQNVMNPEALRPVVRTGRAVVTVQDHRVFCPGPGRTLPGGERCRLEMSDPACQECLPDPAYRRRLLRLTAERRDALAGARLVVLSRYMAAELAAAGLPGAAVIPPWVEVAGGWEGPGDTFLLGGRLVRHKDPGAALSAWRRAGGPLPLRVAGEGPLASLFDDRQRLGWLDRDALSRQLAGARALLFPARWQEPFGILGVEALAHGAPVILAASGGPDDWSDAGCVRVPPGDVEGLAASIRCLAADAGRATALGRAGREMVAERFARARVEPCLRALYLAAARRA